MRGRDEGGKRRERGERREGGREGEPRKEFEWLREEGERDRGREDGCFFVRAREREREGGLNPVSELLPIFNQQ